MNIYKKLDIDNFSKNILDNLKFAPFIFYLLHQFSDFLIYKIFFLFSFIFLIPELKKLKFINFKINNNYDLLIFFFLFSFVQTFFVSFIFLDIQEVINPLLKFLITPVIFFLYYFLCTQNENNFYKLLDIYYIFCILASLTILGQFFLKFNLSIFGDALSLRGGNARYASLAGNNLVFSTLFVLPIFYIVFIKKIKNILNFFFIILLMLAALISISKAFLINFFLFFYIVFFIKNISKKTFMILSLNKEKIFFFIFFLICLVFIIILTDNFIKSYIVSTIKIFFGNRSNIFINLKIRFLDSVFYNSDFNFFNFLFGYGLAANGGVFGNVFAINNENLFTTHNQFYDLFAMGGFLMLVSTFFVFFFSFKLFISKQDDVSHFFTAVLIYTFINCLVFNGFIFHPYLSTPFWLSIIYLLVMNKNYEKKI